MPKKSDLQAYGCGGLGDAQERHPNGVYETGIDLNGYSEAAKIVSVNSLFGGVNFFRSHNVHSFEADLYEEKYSSHLSLMLKINGVEFRLWPVTHEVLSNVGKFGKLLCRIAKIHPSDSLGEPYMWLPYGPPKPGDNKEFWELNNVTGTPAREIIIPQIRELKAQIKALKGLVRMQ